MDTSWDVIIVGGGPAGATAALYTARAGLKTLVLDMSMTAGALGITQKIANYPGIPEVITGKELLERMWKQAGLYGAEFRKEKVTATLFSEDPKQLVVSSGETYRARSVILATGAMGRSSVLPGEEALLGRGVSYCATCDAAFFKGKTVLVYGTGEHAVEEAVFLSRFAGTLHYVSPKKVKPDELPEGAVIHEDTRLGGILGEGKVTGVELVAPSGKERLEADGVFIYTSGSKPVVDYLYGSVDVSEKSCLLVDREFRTNTAGVFACGDVICNDVQQAVVAAAQGCVAALSADKYLRGRKAFVRDYK